MVLVMFAKKINNTEVLIYICFIIVWYIFMKAIYYLCDKLNCNTARFSRWLLTNAWITNVCPHLRRIAMLFPRAFVLRK